MRRSATSRTSRCRRDKMDKFLPLKYFPPDPEYVVPASLKLADRAHLVEMPTSTGEDPEGSSASACSSSR